jgi:Spy/CpxP family protein refolding chaperone
MKTISHLHLKRFVAAAAVALAVPLTASAFGGQKGMTHGGCDGMGMKSGYGHHGMSGDVMPRYLKRLDLTEAQRDRIFDIMHAQAPIMRNTAKTMQKAQSDLRDLTAAPDFSEAKAKELANAAAAAMGEMALNRAKTERQVFDVLTPEQRQQLAELKDRPRQRGDGPRGPAGDGPRPMRGA